MTSRGFLTSFVLPMVTPQRYDKDSSGKFLKNTRVYSKSTNVQTITGNEAKLQRLEDISKFLADSNEFLKLKRLLLCLIHIKTVDKFNIAIFTNLSGHTLGTGVYDYEKENLDLLKKMITNTIGSNLNRKGYNLTTYKEYVAADPNNISIPTHGRYVNFASNKNIILYGYNDIALAGKDYNGDLSDRTDNTNITNMDFQLSLDSTTKLPTSSFSANTLGPLGSDGDFLMSLINSPFKTTIYVNKNLEIVNSRIKQMFTLLETKPIGLLAVPTNSRNFCNHLGADGNFNLNSNNLGARIGAYNTNLMGLNKDHKYVLPFLEIIKQNFVMTCMRWDRYFNYVDSNYSSLNIHYGLKRTDDSLTSDTGYYKELVKTNNSNNISYKKVFYNSFLQNDEGYLKISNTGTHGFINLQGERSGNDTNRIISNLIGSYSSRSNTIVNQKIRDIPPVEWTSPQSRGYILSESFVYNLYNDSDDLYLKVNYASSGNKLGSMMYAAAFNYEGTKDTNIFDFGLWTSTNDGLDSANIDSNSTKTIFYELPFYTFVDQKEYHFSYLLYKEITEQSSSDSATSGFNFSDSARPWKISTSCHLLRQQINNTGDVVFEPFQIINNTQADLVNTFNTAGDTNAVDLISQDLNVEDPPLENRDDVDGEEDQEGDGEIVTEKDDTDTTKQLKDFPNQRSTGRLFTQQSNFIFGKLGPKLFKHLRQQFISRRTGTNNRRRRGLALRKFDTATNQSIEDSNIVVS